MLHINTYYHIYNHANGSENLFKTDNNYKYFLNKYNQHISPIADTYAYCLMPNHFHFLVKIKDEDSFKSLPKFKTMEMLDLELIQSYVSKQFSNLFSCYTQSFNKMFERKGSLFIKNFKRKEVKNEAYFAKLVHYIHANPIHHGFTKQIEDWKYSSYRSYISEKETKIKRAEAMEWFGSLEDFKQAHHEPIDRKFKVEFD